MFIEKKYILNNYSANSTPERTNTTQRELHLRPVETLQHLCWT